MESPHILSHDTVIDEPRERDHWSLSWKPDGHCEHFTKEAIMAHAPAASGVYGLFNFDCQIFIGESANIREALLRLEQEGGLHSEPLRPTGFSFELCPHASRKEKAAELVARYRPVLQTVARADDVRVAPRELYRSRGAEPKPGREARTDTHEFPAHVEKRRQARPRAKRAGVMMLSSVVVAAAAAAIFYFENFDLVKIGDLVSAKSSAGVPRAPAPKPRQQAKGTARTEKAPKGDLGTGAEAGEVATARQSNGAMQSATAAGAEDSERQKFLASENASRANDVADKRWSVQVSAVPERDVAERLAQQLIAQGYDSYVVQAEVKGQTYYRVRAGRFNTRGEAESTRESLTQQESSHGAYVTTD